MSIIQQIIETAKKQHERGELSIHELDALQKKWGVCLSIDGDKVDQGQN